MTIINEIPDLFKAFKITAEKVAITGELYETFLNVLTPKFKTRDSFVFQENDGEIIEFTKTENNYFAAFLIGQFSDKDYSIVFNVYRTSASEKFLLNSINFINDDVESELLNKLVGNHFLLISDLENKSGFTLET